MKKISKKVEDKHLTDDEAEILRRYTCFTGTCVTGTKVHILTDEILRRYNRLTGTNVLVFLVKKSTNIDGRNFFFGAGTTTDGRHSAWIRRRMPRQ